MRLFLPLLFGIAITSAARAADPEYSIQLIYPDNNVSSRSIIEFRARNPSLTGEKSVGHAFVLVGRELDNGLRVYYSIGGFYPEPGSNTFKTIKNTLNGPGEVTYKIPDLKYDTTFTAYISAEQERIANYILKNWDDKNYALVGRNCADLVRDIAQAVGLDVGAESWADLETPWSTLKALGERNHINTPAEAEAAQKREDIDVRRGVNKVILDRERKRQKEREEAARIAEARERMEDRRGDLGGSGNTVRTDARPIIPAPIPAPPQEDEKKKSDDEKKPDTGPAVPQP